MAFGSALNAAGLALQTVTCRCSPGDCQLPIILLSPSHNSFLTMRVLQINTPTLSTSALENVVLNLVPEVDDKVPALSNQMVEFLP
jgi:hypothetical protein